jgi:hypothetical protein
MRTICSILVAAMLACGTLSGCSRPSVPSLTGPGKFQDMSQIKKGMSANEVERVMGPKHKTVYEEGIQGMDGGIYIWEFSSGRVYFNTDGVVRVQSYDK